MTRVIAMVFLRGLGDCAQLLSLLGSLSSSAVSHPAPCALAACRPACGVEIPSFIAEHRPATCSLALDALRLEGDDSEHRSFAREAADAFEHGQRELLGTLVGAIRRYPIPAVLIGLGIAVLLGQSLRKDPTAYQNLTSHEGLASASKAEHDRAWSTPPRRGQREP